MKTIFKILFLLIFPSVYASSDSIIDKELLLVNIANLSRDEIALVLINIQKQQPKVIGIDAWFTKENNDTLLVPALNNYNNVILAAKLYSCKGNNCDSISGQYFPYANQSHVRVNYRSLTYYPALKFQKRSYPFFCLALLNQYDSSIVKKYYKKKIYKRPFSFHGNYNRFYGIEGKDILSGNYSTPINLKGKIIIFAYLGETIGHVKHPLFETDYKPSYISAGELPDMYGAILLANIITDIMKKVNPKF